VAARGKDKKLVRAEASRYRRYLKRNGSGENLWRTVRKRDRSRTVKAAAKVKQTRSRSARRAAR
jgi:hypothetical protein